MNKKKAIKIATASAIAASGFVAVAPAQAAVKTTNVNTVVNTAISKMAAAYDGYHKPGLQGKIPATAKIRQLTTNAEAAYDAAVAAIAKDGGTKSQKTAFTKKLNAKKYLLTRAQGYVKAIDVNLNAAKKTLDKAVASGKAKDVKAAEAALQKTAATFKKTVEGVYGPGTRKVLVAKYHVPALEKAATVKDELTVYNAYKQIEDGNLIEKDIAKAGTIIDATKPTVEKLRSGNKRDTKLVKNLLDAVDKNNAKYYEHGHLGEVKSIMAINTTTVEVTYKDAVKDVDASKYSIEGLTVTNAVVKQTDSKTVVLTTSAQDGAKEYTVKSGAIKVGTFKGISAVVPASIAVTSNSQQGVVGKNVTVKAQVTVATGQSKAGIPVTFNISAGDKKFNKDHVVEVYTNADGIAEYSYTQYAGGEDLVTAYATGNANVRSTSGKVYWGVAERLTVTEVTTGNALTNGSKKVYKVKATTETGGVQSGYVNVTFAENVEVTPDKGVKGVTVTDASYGSGTTPYQYTNGNKNAVRVELKNGEASFTITGSDASVTPIVFFDGAYNSAGSWNVGDDKLASTELQAKAPTVKFENVQSVQLAVESVGTKDAAGISTASQGGRDYKVTVKDKAGKLAPKGTTVYLTVTEADLEGNVWLQRTAANGGNFQFNGKNKVAITTDNNGVATFTLIGDKNDYATPTLFIDNGAKPNELDTTDAQTKGEIVYFGDAVVTAAKLSVLDAPTPNGDVVTSVKSNEHAYFEYQVVDQNGKEYTAGTHKATFEVYNSGYNAVEANGVTVAPFSTKSVPFSAVNGKATLDVTSTGITSVTVNVSGSQYSLGNQTASISFTDTNVLKDGVAYPGTVKSVDYAKDEVVLTIGGVDHTLTYTNDKIFIKGVAASENAFEGVLTVGDTVTYIKGAVESFDITNDVTPDTTQPTANAVYTGPVTAVTEVKSKAKIDFAIDASANDEINLTSSAVGVAGNAINVKVIDAVANSGATEASYNPSSKTITVELKDDGTDVTAKVKEVADAINVLTAVTTLRATTTDNGTLVADALGGTFTTTGGVDPVTAVPAKLTMTFSEAMNINTLDSASEITIKNGATTRTLGTGATFGWNTAEKILTISLGADTDVIVTDSITASSAKDKAGNALDLTAPIVIN